MLRLASVEVIDLFGYLHHSIEMRQDAPTILTAPNGAGKTHVLTLLRASLSLDLKVLLATSFGEFRVSLVDRRTLVIRRRVDEKKGPEVRVCVERDGHKTGDELYADLETIDAMQPDLPAYIRSSGPDRWTDTRTGRVFNPIMLERRFGKHVHNFRLELADRVPEIAAICSPPYPVFIDTKRLDIAGLDSADSDFAHVRPPDSVSAASRIHEYTSQLRAEVTEARRGSIQATQSADLSFAARALAAARDTVKEADLHMRYDRTVDIYETLARNSLAVGAAPMEFPARTTPTVRRILSVFLDDWDNRLQPLIPLNEKIQTLREILDSKLAPSGKRTAMSSRGDLEFRALRNGARIRVTNLSSGEQHLVALFTLLLFSAKRGSLVLIDEPEISFHAAWKHAFLDDITRVAAISDLQIVIATHSSAIVNGHWNLTEELNFSMNDHVTGLTDFEASDDDDEFEG